MSTLLAYADYSPSAGIRMPPSQHKFYALALYDFDAVESNHLSFSAGQVLSIVDVDPSGWWAAMSLESQHGGWVSMNYMLRLETGLALAYLKSQYGAVAVSALKDDSDNVSLASTSDRRSLASLASMATYGSEYPSEESIDLPELTVQDLAGASTLSFDSYQGSSSSGDLTSPRTYTSEYSYFSQESSTTTVTPPTNPYEVNYISSPIHPSPSSRVSYNRTTAQLWPMTVTSPSAPHSRSLSETLSSSPRTAGIRGPSITIPPTQNRLGGIRELSPMSIDSGGSGLTASPTLSLPASEARSVGPTTRTRKLEQILGTEGADVASATLTDRSTEPLPWYLKPSWTDADLIIADDGRVQFGTLKSLIERLTVTQSLPSVEVAYRDAFLMTYRSFATADDIVDLLSKRYEMMDPNGMSEDEFDEWKEKKLRPVQTLVLNVFSSWLKNHHMLDVDRDTLERVKDFLTLIKTPAKNERIAKGLLRLIEHHRTEPDQPSSPTSQISPTNKRKKAAIGIRRKSQKADILKFDAGEFAQQLALIAHRLYTDIRAPEILAWAKCEDPDHPDVQNLMKLCNFNGKLVKLVKYTILTTDTLSRRREMVNHFIKIDEKSRSLGNFAAVGSLTAGLSSSCLEKLGLTWAHADKYQRLESLRTFTNPANSFLALRNAYKHIEGPCIPFFGFVSDPWYPGMFLPMAATIYQQQPDDVVGVPGGPETLINFAKRQRLAEVCADALRYQNKSYPPETVDNPDLIQFIEDQLFLVNAVDDDWFWTKAAEVQRGEEDHSDIRRGLEAAGF